MTKLNIKKTDYLHFDADGKLRGISGVNDKGDFVLFNDIISERDLLINKNNLVYKGDNICLNDKCLTKDHIVKMSDFFNIKKSLNLTDDLIKKNPNFKNKNINATVLIDLIRKIIKMYRLSSEVDKKQIIEEMFHPIILLPSLNMVVEQKDNVKFILDGTSEYDIYDQKANKLSGTSLEFMKRQMPDFINDEFNYRIKITNLESPNIIASFHKDKWVFNAYDSKRIELLEIEYFEKLYETEIMNIRQIDKLMISELKPRDFNILINNIQKISLEKGKYTYKKFIENINSQFNSAKKIIISKENQMDIKTTLTELYAKGANKIILIGDVGEDNFKKKYKIVGGIYDGYTYDSVDSEDLNIDFTKLMILLKNYTKFETKSFRVGEYHSLKSNIPNYVNGTLSYEYISIGYIDDYEVRIIRGEKIHKLKSNWNIYFKYQTTIL